MLVITNPATQAAADAFAVGKRAQGWRTNVFQTGAGAGQIGTTPAQIQAFIRGRLTAPLCIHPSYVTIMGDDDLVPTFTDGPSGIPSDLKYSLKTDADELPDLAIGRILGNDQAARRDRGDEDPRLRDDRADGQRDAQQGAVAAQFQDDDNDGQENRTFITMAETIAQRARRPRRRRRPRLRREPRQQPAALPGRQRAAGGAAEGRRLRLERHRRADHAAGWNEGRFMVVHRDHGGSDGWSTRASARPTSRRSRTATGCRSS